MCIRDRFYPGLVLAFCGAFLTLRRVVMRLPNHRNQTSLISILRRRIRSRNFFESNLFSTSSFANTCTLAQIEIPSSCLYHAFSAYRGPRFVALLLTKTNLSANDLYRQTFFYLVSLRTGTEFSVLTLLVNKVSGFYGILALFTGYHLSAIQFSMYVYSIGVLILALYLAPHIRSNQSPLQNLALAWLYVIDSLINIVYTTLFGLGWFVLLAQHLTDGSEPLEGKLPVPGGKTMNDTAGFTDPEHHVSHVDVIADPSSGEAVTVGHEGSALNQAVFQSGSVMSILVMGTLWLVRLYFCLIVMAYARGALRQYILASSQRNPGYVSEGESSKALAENPFRAGREEGEGWRGKLGRFLISFPRTYWLGKDDEDEWVRGAGEKFAMQRFGGRGSGSAGMAPGTGERERRARSGTGPPVLLAQRAKSAEREA